MWALQKMISCPVSYTHLDVYKRQRRDNVSVCVMAKDDLLQWAYNDLTYKAKLAYEGGGEFACGDWCRFCKAKAVCRKRAEYNLELAKYDFEMPDTLELSLIHI